MFIVLCFLGTFPIRYKLFDEEEKEIACFHFTIKIFWGKCLENDIFETWNSLHIYILETIVNIIRLRFSLYVASPESSSLEATIGYKKSSEQPVSNEDLETLSSGANDSAMNVDKS